MNLFSPTDLEKYLYVKQNRFFIYSYGIFSFVALVVGMWFFSRANPYFYFYGIFATLITTYLSLSYLIGVFGRNFNLKKHNDIIKTPIRKSLIDIYLPSAGEEVQIIENTYKHVAKLIAPKDTEVIVHVLDDSGRDYIRELSEVYRFNYIRRPNKGELKKAGNLRYAFTKTQGDFFVVFDADFCPRPDFLLETIPYFFHNEKIGIVQTPQYFEVSSDKNWIENGAAYIQEIFYRLIQVSRNTFNGAICVGTNAVYRRKALEEFGGTAPIEHSEDVHTGFSIHNNGGIVQYLPIILAKGLCPDTLPSFFIQQYRWATGSLSLCMTKKFWFSKLTCIQKLCYFSGMLYYFTSLGIIFYSLPTILLLVFRPEMLLWYNSFFSLPSFVFGTLYLALWTKSKYGIYDIKSRQVAQYAHLFALLDKIRKSTVPWIPTATVKTNKRFLSFIKASMVWNTILCITTVFLVGLRIDDDGMAIYNFVPTLLLLLFNFYINMLIIIKE